MAETRNRGMASFILFHSKQMIEVYKVKEQAPSKEWFDAFPLYLLLSETSISQRGFMKLQESAESTFFGSLLLLS